jgi:hypothetical protein
VQFIGSDAGTIDVQSVGSIIISNAINNPKGVTSFRSTAGSIDAQGFGSVNGNTIRFNAAKGIGVNSVIRTDLLGAASSMEAVTTTGPINIQEIAGTLTYTNITTGAYPFWGYEFVTYDNAVASVNAKAFANNFINLIKSFDSTNSIIAPNIKLTDMKVNRTVDGGNQ